MNIYCHQPQEPKEATMAKLPNPTCSQRQRAIFREKVEEMERLVRYECVERSTVLEFYRHAGLKPHRLYGKFKCTVMLRLEYFCSSLRREIPAGTVFIHDEAATCVGAIGRAIEVNGGQEATAYEALELLIGLARTELRFFRRQLVEVVWSMLHIEKAESLEEGTIHLEIEFVIKLSESREHARGMMRKLPHVT
ncbi:importin-5-like protein [Tanacetum coccineum]